MLSLLQLAPEEYAAGEHLIAFERDHPGVRVITPHHRDEPWRAVIDEGTVPGDAEHESRAVGGYLPSELLAKLRDLFPGTGQDPGP